MVPSCASFPASAFTPGSLCCCQKNIGPQKGQAAALRAEGTPRFPLINHISNSCRRMPYPLALLALLFPLSFATPPGGGNCFAHFMNEDTVAAQLAKGDGS